jgi:hypothetical protein
MVNNPVVALVLELAFLIGMMLCGAWILGAVAS